MSIDHKTVLRIARLARIHVEPDEVDAYAEEIRTPEFGMGLEGLIRTRTAVLSGIVNGIDTKTWNPATDAALPRRYNMLSLARRNAIGKRPTGGVGAECSTGGGVDRYV